MRVEMGGEWEGKGIAFSLTSGLAFTLHGVRYEQSLTRSDILYG